MNTNKIILSIWFHTNDGKLSEILDYYKSIFGDSFKNSVVFPLGETPSGNAEMCEVNIFEKKYSFMSTEKEHDKLNDSVSLTLNCEDQTEIDKYWDYFTNEGKESQCGWCIDKYGLRWQVLPQNLGELMKKPAAWETMLKQKKIVIAEY